MIRVMVCVAAAALVVIFVSLSYDDTDYTSHFDVNTTYYDEIATVQFADKTGGTHQVSMEIQGMRETLFRTYDSHSFTDDVHFGEPPQYGWGAHPILFHITHDTLGNVTLKTEFRDAGQPQADIIFVKP